MLKQQSGCGFHGRVGCGRDQFSAHDLMWTFIKRRPVTIGFGQCPDVWAYGLEQVPI